MSHRVNHYHEQLIEHLDERKWSDEDKQHFLHLIGHSALMSEQGALSILEFQQATDERVQAEKEFDRWAIGQQFGSYALGDVDGEALEPGQLFVPGQPIVADAGWDDNGNYLTFRPGNEA